MHGYLMDQSSVQLTEALLATSGGGVGTWKHISELRTITGCESISDPVVDLQRLLVWRQVPSWTEEGNTDKSASIHKAVDVAT